MPPSRCTVRRCWQVGTTVYPEQLDYIEPAFFLQQDLNCINIAICILRLLKVEHRPLCSPQLFCKHPLPHPVLLLSHPRARVGGRWGWGALLLLVFPGFRQTVGGRGRGGTGSPPSPSQSLYNPAGTSCVERPGRTGCSSSCWRTFVAKCRFTMGWFCYCGLFCSEADG